MISINVHTQRGNKMSENRVTIKMSGGLVTQVYSTLHPSKLDVELLDFDAAERLSRDAVARLSQRFSDVERTCRKLSIDVNVGLPDTEPQDSDSWKFGPQEEDPDAFRVAGWD